ncbi:hypothetical protein [Crocosphaera sp. Alani8]|uniref:hypothetical protein n=1 Tax=Crocosphaera sp. Alani8 TaxID=3038952 RepID=UPI00313C3E34
MVEVEIQVEVEGRRYTYKTQSAITKKRSQITSHLPECKNLEPPATLNELFKQKVSETALT